jgi:hypothetical protein
MNYKCWQLGRLQTLIGLSDRWGVELTVDIRNFAVCIHLLNAYIVFEWWPKDVGP